MAVIGVKHGGRSCWPTASGIIEALSGEIMLSSLLFSAFLLAGMPTAVATPAAPPPATPLPTPQFRRYRTADGLPSSSVYTVVQAPDGAMWFGTKSGIARYDGVDFKVFRHVAGDPQSLSNNGIATLLFDRGGHLWAGGLEAALNRYDERTGTFRHWKHDPADPSSLGSDKVWSAAQDGDGTLWVGTATGLDRMRADGRGFDHVVVTGNDPAALGTVGALYVDTHGRLWVGSDNGVFRRDAAGGFQPIKADPPDAALDAWRIEGDAGEVRIASSHGLFVVRGDDVARKVGRNELPDTNVLSSMRDRAGRLWIGTQRGLFLQMRDGAPVQPVTDQPGTGSTVLEDLHRPRRQTRTRQPFLDVELCRVGVDPERAFLLRFGSHPCCLPC